MKNSSARHHPFDHGSLAVLAAFLAACGTAPTPSSAAPDPELANQQPPDVAPGPDDTPPDLPGRGMGAPKTEPFGGEHWGFVEASSDDGRVVFIRHFPGAERPSFGHHGESMGGAPTLTAFDLATGAAREIDELIDVDATRRFFLVIDDDALWLVYGPEGRWTRIEGVDMASDGNACLPPRQANFSGNGKRVGWVDGTASHLEVRDLETDATWKVTATGPLWRGWPDDEGRGAVLAEVPSGSSGWPVQNTSCACRWCNRFAASYGFYGWSGPKFTLQHVDEQGARTPGEPPESEAHYHGPSASGCKLQAAKTDSSGLDRGPWRWVCAAE